MSETVTTLGLIQMRIPETKEDALRLAIERIEEAAAKGAQIIALPELFLTPYFCRTQDPAFFDLAEPVPGPTIEALAAVAKRLEVVLIVPLFERQMEGLYYNTAAVIDADGSYLGKYRKTHIPQDPGFEEKFYFAPGDLPYRSWKTHYGKIGVLICWDQWFPEAARATALDGAEILFYPTAIGWLPEEKAELGAGQHHAWETVQCGHAVANGCIVAAINRVGTEGQTEFWGRSFVSNPYGQVSRLEQEEETLIYRVDREEVKAFRRIWPFFRDRRPERYG